MIPFVLASIIVGLLIIKYIEYHIKVIRLKKISGNIPGPKPIPFFGNSLSLGMNSCDYLQNMIKCTKQYGPTTAIWSGSDLNVYISDKEDMRTILSSNVHIRKAKIYDFMVDLLGSGLATADGAFWKKNRRIIGPTLNYHNLLVGFTNVFNKNYTIMADMIEKEVGTKGFNIGQNIGDCAIDNIFETSLRSEPHAQVTQSKIAEVMLLLFEVVSERSFKFWLHPNVLFRLSSAGRTYSKALNFLNDIIREKIIKKNETSNKKKLTEKRLRKDENDIEDKKATKSFMDLMIEMRMDPDTYISDEQLRFEIITMINGGHGTINSTLGFCFYELARHQDIQNKVIEEIKEYFGEDNRDPTYDDLQHFPYMERVIKETLRVYPFPYFARYLTQDVPLPTGYTLPAGSTVVFDWIHLQKDPEEYPDPENFNPDNFLPEHCVKRHPYAYVPFSAGPRNCPGKKYAMANMKCAIIHMLRRYKVLPAETLPGLKLAYEVVIISVTGFNVRVEKR